MPESLNAGVLAIAIGSIGVEDGLPQPCVLNLDTPELVSREWLVDYIAMLSAARWHEVCAALTRSINC